mmetsp:Transcript_86727/g.220946  ORF Transcript_86727/g.220946 Transcript_86727/m.220946 type:complete len:195 (+) Transcript_86727:50-634(+)
MLCRHIRSVHHIAVLRQLSTASVALPSPKRLGGIRAALVAPPVLGAAVAAQSIWILGGSRGAAAQAEETEEWVTTSSGLQYRDVVVGTGEAPVKGQTVYVHYTGKLENGKEFDSSRPRNEPLEFPVGTGKVIAGWDEGILSMRVGGKRQLKIPPELGYGRRGTPGGPIPPNAALFFDCELVALGSKSLFARIFG